MARGRPGPGEGPHGEAQQLPAELRLRKLHGVDSTGELRGRSGHTGARGHSRAAHGGRQRLRARKSAVSTVEAERRVPESLTAPVEGRTAGRRADRQNRRRNPADRAAVRGGERGGGHGFRSVWPVSCARSRERKRDTRGGVFGLRTF
ncbi:MAG: hypothetical protein ACLR4Z_09185 [Butyricicoccaceae bacterium]